MRSPVLVSNGYFGISMELLQTNTLKYLQMALSFGVTIAGLLFVASWVGALAAVFLGVAMVGLEVLTGIIDQTVFFIQDGDDDEE